MKQWQVYAIMWILMQTAINTMSVDGMISAIFCAMFSVVQFIVGLRAFFLWRKG